MKLSKAIFIICLALCTNEFIHAQIISTFAGNGTALSVFGQIGDGGLAVSASIKNPTSICFDSKGNMFIASGNFIRKIAASTNIITTIAGTGNYGSSGDGGPAINATIQYAYGMCIDAFDNLYFTDHGGHRVRRIDVAGIITTVAGNGTYGFSGDGGKATDASLSNPRGICCDASGNLYVCDSDNSRIRKINKLTGIISTIIGIGPTANSSGDGGLASLAGIPSPVDIKFDNHGNIIFAEVSIGITCRIRKVDTTSGIISTIAGNNTNQSNGDGGLAINASLIDPASVCVDYNNNIFITEFDDSKIRRIDASSGIITTVAGNGITGFSGDGGLAINAQMNEPDYVIFDGAGNLFVADAYNNRIRKITQLTSSTCSPQVTITTNTATICKGSDASFTAFVTNGGNAVPTYRWLVNGNDVYNGGQTFSSTNLNDQDVINCIYSSASGCIATVASNNSITINVKDIPIIKLTSDTVCYLGNKLLLNPTIVSTDPVTYLWSPNVFLDNDSIQTPTSSPQSNISYQLQVTSSNNCLANATINISVLNISVPNGFSPNGDNINDVWLIKGLMDYKNCTVDVFTRSGQSVFHSIGYNQPWDGTFKGRPLPVGTYYYVINPKNGVPSYSGSLTILR